MTANSADQQTAAEATPRQELLDVLGNDGALAQHLSGYEQRPQQLEMAELVARAFDDSSAIVVEAATGTGKTLAYLIPALQAGRRTLVSTATKTLQDQILSRDIPLLRQVLGRPFQAVSLKGRQNYVCLWQYESFLENPRFVRNDDASWWPQLRQWIETTETGDRGELEILPDDFATWRDLSIGTESCLGSDCKHYDECFIVRARERAAEADVLVVNHHLFFADLSLRQTRKVELLPDVEALVFDEAHHLEETAASFFGVQISSYRLAELTGDTVRFLDRENALTNRIRLLAGEVEGAAQDFFTLVGARCPDGDEKRRLDVVLEAEDSNELQDAASDLDVALGELRSGLQGISRAGEVSTRLAARCDTIAKELKTVLDCERDDRLYMVERRGRGVFLQSYPIDLRPTLRNLVHERKLPRIYTSATLSTDGDFRYFRYRLGLPDDIGERVLPAVFDYMQQSVLYIPTGLPQPNAPEFIEHVARHIEELVSITEGRAFLLFTSYRNMRRAFALLRNKLPYNTLIQGSASRNALLENFRNDEQSVLFATASFWEGVDVPGSSLSLVVIDKLPFANPSDPVTSARLDAIESRGGNAFRDYTIPQAAIALKQGYGRLIRHSTDTGIVCLLDERLLTRGYGKRFLKTIPRSRRTRDVEVVRKWWQHTRESVDTQDSIDD